MSPQGLRQLLDVFMVAALAGGVGSRVAGEQVRNQSQLSGVICGTKGMDRCIHIYEKVRGTD